MGRVRRYEKHLWHDIGKSVGPGVHRHIKAWVCSCHFVLGGKYFYQQQVKKKEKKSCAYRCNTWNACISTQTHAWKLLDMILTFSGALCLASWIAREDALVVFPVREKIVRFRVMTHGKTSDYDGKAWSLEARSVVWGLDFMTVDIIPTPPLPPTNMKRMDLSLKRGCKVAILGLIRNSAKVLVISSGLAINSIITSSCRYV